MAKAIVEVPKGYEERAQFCHNKVARELLTLMERKKTNLAFNPDVTSANELLHLAKTIGPHICMLKTHIDLLQDFTPEVSKQLKEIAKQQHFILFEDRKFADIGSVAKEQYAGGIYRIAEWAPITNAHIIAGPSTIEALWEVAQPLGNALLLLAEMSSKGALTDTSYAKAAVQMARAYPDFVMGFICQKRLVDDPGLLHITPGVNLTSEGDTRGQQYRTPEKAILSQGNDIVIVGRGIYEAQDPAATAQMYRLAAWKAYEKRRDTE